MLLVDRKHFRVLLIFFFIFWCVVSDDGESPEEMKRKKSSLIKKHLKRLKKLDGGIKLIGGRGEFEGKC